MDGPLSYFEQGHKVPHLKVLKYDKYESRGIEYDSATRI